MNFTLFLLLLKKNKLKNLKILTKNYRKSVAKQILLCYTYSEPRRKVYGKTVF